MKSHVSMEQAQCPVCLTIFDTGNILLDRRLKQGMEQRTVTHRALCEKCQKLKDDGFVALIELEREPRNGEHPLEIPRTGNVAHVRASAWPFAGEPPERMVCVVMKGVIAKLQAMTEKPSDPSDPV